MSLKAEHFQNQKNHLVQNSCFLYNNPIKNCKKQVRKGYPLAGPSIAIINTCNNKQLFWLALLFSLFLYSFNCGWMVLICLFDLWGGLGPGIYNFEATPPLKQDEAHEPECRHVCWRTKTILIYHIFPANPLVGHPDVTHWGDTLVGHPSYLTLLLDTLVRHSYWTLLLDTPLGHSYLTFL